MAGKGQTLWPIALRRRQHNPARRPGTPVHIDFKQEDLKALIERTMPFGKYQGRVLIDLPEPYLLWLASKGFPNGELGRLMALALMLKMDGTEKLLEPLRQSHG